MSQMGSVRVMVYADLVMEGNGGFGRLERQMRAARGQR